MKKPSQEEKYPFDVYDKNGKRITNLEKYRNKEGEITIPVYDKDGNRITDLKKYNYSCL